MKSIQEYHRLLQERISPKRYHHSLCVAEQAIALAPAFGADLEKAEIAGLLHDSCKEMPWEEQLQYLKTHDILLDIQYLDNPPVWHGITASVFLKEEWDVEDPEILSAVCWHTTGRKGMTPLEQVVFLADLSSADRQYPDADAIRALLPEHSNEAIVQGTAYGIQAALHNGAALILDSVEAYNYYLEKVKQKEGTEFIL